LPLPRNVEPGQIAKTLSLKIKDKIVLIVARAMRGWIIKS
jgi:prolyl-tRNA editing enzyme YbaK/EbsC (Cys-tRNA(Pro) deacylase)